MAGNVTIRVTVERIDDNATPAKYSAEWPNLTQEGAQFLQDKLSDGLVAIGKQVGAAALAAKGQAKK